MYPSPELTDLAGRKAVLKARISRDRLRCATMAAEAARPLQWIDRLILQWRKIPPMAKMAVLPLGLLLRRRSSSGRKTNFVGRVVRFVPMMITAIKLLNAQRR